LTIAIGIGANVAIFTVVSALLLRPLPYAQPQQLVNVWESIRDGGRGAVAYPNYLDLKSQNDVFSQSAAWSDIEADIAGSAHAERLLGENVSPSYFAVLGIKPALGRFFNEQDSRAPMVIISDALWKSRFDGAADAVGRALNVNGSSFTVIGVAPTGFVGLSGTAQIWAPIETHDLIYPQVARFDFLHSRDVHWVRVIARLKPGVSVQAASTELKSIGDRLAAAYPNENHERSLALASTHQDFVKHYRAGAIALMCAVGFVLLVACANVANLLLARIARREREFATRIALGASTSDLVGHVFGETLVLVASGGVAGVALFAATRTLLPALLPISLPAFANVQFDWRVLVFAIACVVATAALVTILASQQLMRRHPAQALHGQGVGASVQQSRTRAIIVIAEVALAVMLCTGAGLMTKSLWRLQQVDTGFQSDHLLTLRFDPPNGKYEGPARLAIGEQIAERAAAVPGVKSAAATAVDPFVWPGLNRGYLPEAREEVTSPDNFFYEEITPGYFRTMGIPLLQGRDFTGHDDLHAPGVAVVSRSFAQRTWQTSDVLGKHIKFGGADGNWLTIVGVADDAQIDDLHQDRHDLAIVYVPLLRSEAIVGLSLIARTKTDPATMIDTLRSEIQRFDPDMPVYSTATLEDRLAGQRGTARAYAQLTSSFAFIAAGLAILGVYGVLAFSVAQRSREIGVRIALGAQREQVLSLVLRSAGKLIAIGLAVGVVAAAIMTRYLASLLYRVAPLDLAVFTIVVLLLGAAGLCAGFIPAHRAATIEPVEALRLD
jgi:putative ABC transport system permease protein